MASQESEVATGPSKDPVMLHILRLLESMDGRLARLEGQVSALQTASSAVPGLLAGVTDTVDSAVARAAEHGVDVDEHVRSGVSLVGTLTAPSTAQGLQRLVARVDHVEQSLEMLASLPGMAAGVVDTVDGAVARLQAAGIDVDARLGALVAAAEAVSRPGVLDTLVRLADRSADVSLLVDQLDHIPGAVAGAVDTLDGWAARLLSAGIDPDTRLTALASLSEVATRPEALAGLQRLLSRPEALHQLADLAEQAPGVLAGAVDTLDGVMARLHQAGVDVDQRLVAALPVLDRATRPETLAALSRLLDNSHQLNALADIAEVGPGMVAGAVDTLDSLAARITARGIDLDERAHLLAEAAEALTDPVIIKLLKTVAARGPDLTRLVDTLLVSGIFDAEAVDVVGSTSKAVVQTRIQNPAPVGAFGALTAVFDPDVQRALGFAVEFARTFGRRLERT